MYCSDQTSRLHDHRSQYDSNLRATLRAHCTGLIPNEIGALVALTYLSLAITIVEGASVYPNQEMKPRTSPTHRSSGAGGGITEYTTIGSNIHTFPTSDLLFP